jgi:hypothetical protein
VKEVQAEPAHEQEDEETAGPGAEEAVVQPDDPGAGGPECPTAVPLSARTMLEPEVAMQQGVGQDDRQQHGHHGAEPVGRDAGRDPGAGECGDEGGRGGGQDQSPVDPHVAKEPEDGARRACETGQLARAEQGGVGNRGIGGEQRG